MGVSAPLPAASLPQPGNPEHTISRGSGGGGGSGVAARSCRRCRRCLRSSMRRWMLPTSMISRRRSTELFRTRSWPWEGHRVPCCPSLCPVSSPPAPLCPRPPHLDGLEAPVPGATAFLFLQFRCAHPLHGRRLPCAIFFELLHEHRAAAWSWLGMAQPHHLQPTGGGGFGHSSQLAAEVYGIPACPIWQAGHLPAAQLCPVGRRSPVGNLMPLRALGHLAASPGMAGSVPASSHANPQGWA